jgi:hypothetical protein
MHVVYSFSSARSLSLRCCTAGASITLSICVSVQLTTD